MFSHVLANYQNNFLNFATKAKETLEATANTLKSAPQYEFCILKELSQSLSEGKEEDAPVEGESSKEVVTQDKDQMLFFQVWILPQKQINTRIYLFEHNPYKTHEKNNSSYKLNDVEVLIIESF